MSMRSICPIFPKIGQAKGFVGELRNYIETSHYVPPNDCGQSF